MKSRKLYWVVCLTLVILVSGSAWAADPPALSSNDTPAILAALDAGSVTVLDDQTAMAIRGQDYPYSYVLVKVLGVNALDYGPGIQWTWNPLGFRYGANGGPNWSHPLEPVADSMDQLFLDHDNAYASGADKLTADQTLIAQLIGLLGGPDAHAYPYWGTVYNPGTTLGLAPGTVVMVSGFSLIGNRFFFGWKQMPYSEYARREALAGMEIVAFGRILLQ